MYCSHCGNPVKDQAEADEHAAAEAAGAAEGVADTVSSAEVEIARINAQRDIKLAQIQRGIAAREIEAETTEDAVKADILDAAMAPPPEPEPVPVVVEDAPAEEIPTEEPPPVVDAEPEPAVRKGGNPWW